jgi:translation elongation factor EF-G
MGRHVRQTCCPGYFAVVTLRLEIDFGPDAVDFVNGLDKCDLDAGVHGTDWMPFVSEVVEGVRMALAELSPDGSPVQALKVTLLAMKVHPVDSQPRHFRRAAALAVTEAVGQVGLVEGPV